MLHDCAGVVDYTPLSRLHALERLDVVVRTRAEAEALARLDITQLRSLTYLSLNWVGAGPPVPYGLPGQKCHASFGCLRCTTSP